LSQRRADSIPRLLLIQDDPAWQHLFCSGLAEQGFEVTPVTTLLEAQLQLGALRPHGLVLDADLKDAPASLACMRLRRLPEAAGLPLLVLVSSEDEPCVAGALAAGASDVAVRAPYWPLIAARLRRLQESTRLSGELVASRRLLEHAEERAHRERVAAFRARARIDQDGLTGLLGRAGFLRAAQAVHEAQQHRWVREQAMLIGQEEARSERLAAPTRPSTPAELSALVTDPVGRSVRAGLPRQGPAVLMLIDLDRFERINASFGPHAGDEALREVASRLRQAFRNLPQVIFGRLGGDEFGVLFPELPSEQAARHAAQIVLGQLRAPMVCAGREFVLGASIGIAIYQPTLDLAGLPVDLMLTQAAQSLRHARACGGNAAHGPEAAVVERPRIQDDLETRLHRALQRDELRLHYQPIVDPATGRVTGFEALMRWQCDERLMAPAEFIPLAEQTGAIVPMGEWAVREALRQLRIWRREGIQVPTVSVNIHSQQLRLDEFAQAVARELEINGLEGQDLEIELTETGLIQDMDRAVDSLRGLKRLGVSVALDDFGTGYSSLSYLSRLPVDTLKIDRSFVDTLGARTQSEAVVRSITALAQALGLSTVAEGVETRQQLISLQELGCDDVQGYLVSRPLPAAEVAQWWQFRQQAPFGSPDARSF